MSEFFIKVAQNFKDTSVLEIIAFITAIVYVILASKENRNCFIFGLISSLIFVYICYTAKYYFDVGINTYYVLMSVYGYWVWSKKKNEPEVKIRKMPSKILIVGMLLSAIISALLATTAERFSDAQLPYLDAFTTVFAIFATWMVIKKYIENWLIWIVVDLVASGMYFYKELNLTGVLYVIYTVIAVFGYFKWKKILLNPSK